MILGKEVSKLNKELGKLEGMVKKIETKLSKPGYEKVPIEVKTGDKERLVMYQSKVKLCKIRLKCSINCRCKANVRESLVFGTFFRFRHRKSGGLCYDRHHRVLNIKHHTIYICISYLYFENDTYCQISKL